MEVQSPAAPKVTDKDASLVLQKVGLHHFAFLKGYLEGLDIRALAHRYLETFDEIDLDLRVVYSTLDWIRDDLRLVAKRHGKSSIARVIMLDPAQLQVTNSAIPTLEEFRDDRDPDYFYSEAELIELFRETYKGHDTNNKAARNVRLRRRQAAALFWLQQMAVTTPTDKDHVSAWLRPVLARKLVKVGVNTVGELIDALNLFGPKWYAEVPSLGVKSARSIVRWLTINEEQLGRKINVRPPRAAGQDVAVRTGITRVHEESIVPLEYFRPRAELDGSNGTNRGLRNKSGAENDYDAIQVWLSTYEKGSNTWLSYRCQAERFLLWSILERGKPISSMDTADCVAYRDFLWDLGRLSRESWNLIYRIPEDHWLGKRNTERMSPEWRPFEEIKSPKPPDNIPLLLRKQWRLDNRPRTGVLSPSSQRLAQTILKTMCEFLRKKRYLDSNPWDGIKYRQAHAPEIKRDHSFTQDQWNFIMKQLETLPKDSSYYRLKFILILGYATGLRLTEMAGAVKEDLKYQPTSFGNKGGWVIKVTGKGSKTREVPFPRPVMGALEDYLAYRGFGAFNDVPANCPLFDFNKDARNHLIALNNIEKKSKDLAMMSSSQLYRSLKRFFNKVAKQYEAISKDGADHIRLASTHWLRHTSGSHAVANGVPIEVVQSNFGHASVDTTSIYITAELDRRIELMEQFAQKSLSG